jgi:PAT family acetyl-CoA transporter-like MFS transporter 1
LYRAPLVDSIFLRRLGRRKSWIIPVGALSGVFLISFARLANRLLDHGQTHTEILSLAIIFFLLTFLVATQDIAIDGWSITLLSKENVHWQGICTTIGQTLGYFIAHSGFLLFESEKFCNANVRPLFGWPPQEHGLVSLEVFMYVFGVVFLVTAILVFFFKNEHSRNNLEEIAKDETLDTSQAKKMSLFSAYKIIYKLFKLRSVRLLLLTLFTANVTFIFIP